jgi:hypothetical protein
MCLHKISMTTHMMTSFRTFHLHELCRADFSTRNFDTEGGKDATTFIISTS